MNNHIDCSELCPLTLSFRDVPERGSKCCSSLLKLVPPITDPLTETETQIFSSLINWSHLYDHFYLK